MRAITASLFVVFASMAGVAGAESVESRIPLGSTETRIRGATTVVPVHWGLVSLGGSTLRHMPTGKTQWETLHKVEKDNLYRIAGDDTGRLLASWETEKVFHLFVPRSKTHVEFGKPPKPSEEFRSWSLDDLYLSSDGAHAIVYMHGLTGGVEWTTIAYEYDLVPDSEPRVLFRQAGHTLHNSSKIAVFAVPRDRTRSCDDNSCSPMEGIHVWEIDAGTAVKRTLLRAKGDRQQIARLVWGADDERVAVIVHERGNTRSLLSWKRGDANATYAALPKVSTYDVQSTRMTKSGDVLEAMRTSDNGLEVRRLLANGTLEVVARLKPMPFSDPDSSHDSTVHTFKERANGDLFLHWGDYVVLLPRGKPPRYFYAESFLKRRNEWASADVYVAEPEGLWLGIEIGAGRDFVHLPFAEIEKRATAEPKK